MILGSGRPSVNVAGHWTLSGSVVVVAVLFVSSVESDEAPLLRGMMCPLKCEKVIVNRTTISIILEVKGISLKFASVVLSDLPKIVNK